MDIQERKNINDIKEKISEIRNNFKLEEEIDDKFYYIEEMIEAILHGNIERYNRYVAMYENYKLYS